MFVFHEYHYITVILLDTIKFYVIDVGAHQSQFSVRSVFLICINNYIH
jgi:hypothetical protein